MYLTIDFYFKKLSLVVGAITRNNVSFEIFLILNSK